MVQNTERKTIYYFCDESSQVTDEWLAVGGLAVTAKYVPIILQDIQKLKQESPKKGEVKWSNSKSYGGLLHRQYIDYLFALINQNKAHFHIRFSPMKQYDHNLSGRRKKIDTVSKSYYQLFLHRPVLHYGRHNCDVHIYPDDGECTEHLPNYLEALANDERKKYPQRIDQTVTKIQPRSSEREPLLQLLDVTLGALAAYRNGRHENHSISNVKRELMTYVFEKTGWSDICKSSPRDEIKLNCWNVIPTLKLDQRR